MEITISLKNPPSRATEWQLILHDWNKAQVDSRFGIPITDPAVFEVPAGTIFPLRVDMLIYHNGTIDYRMQSIGTEFPFPAEWYVEAFIPESGSYYYNVATEQFESIAVTVGTGELLIAYAWWEEELGWLEIASSNNWPPNTAIITTWKVINTGDESAVFKTRLLGVESAEAWLTPGASFWFEQPAISLSPGTHQLTLQMLADNEVVTEYPFQVIVSEAVPAPVTGEVFFTLIWHEGLTAWEDLIPGREIPINKDIYLAPWWRSNVTITGHVDLTVTYPDGTSRALAATEFQDYVGRGHGVSFEPFLSSQEGAYTIVVTLSSDGQVLDEQSYSLVVGVVDEYAGSIVKKELEYNESRKAIPVY